MVYELLLKESRDDRHRRITWWLKEKELPWIKERMKTVEATGKPCEILQRVTPQKVTEYALFYKYGYFHYNGRLNRMEWIENRKIKAEDAV